MPILIPKKAHPPPHKIPGWEKLNDDERAALGSYIAQLENAQPWLEWSGKRELPTFAVDPLILQRHEHVAASAILKAARREDVQRSLFAEGELSPSAQLDFYQHEMDWSNRLILGDSLQVMASLARRENLAGQVQMIYLDPPYGIKFASNFQPQIGQRDVKDKADDLSREPETVKAFRDTWHLGVHSYLTYLRDRLTLCRELLHESGSIFVQISDENLHRVRCVMDEVFGVENFVATIAYKKSAPETKTIKKGFNYLIWFSKNKDQVKIRKVYRTRAIADGSTEDPKKLALWLVMPDGFERTLTTEEKRGEVDLPEGAVVFRADKVRDSLEIEEKRGAFDFQGESLSPGKGFCWRGYPDEMERLKKANRLTRTEETLAFKLFSTDSGGVEITSLWDDTAGKIPDMKYVVETNPKIIARCLLMTTDPGDLVLDPTCGSGTTAYVAETWGRRWITTDTSRVALSIARQRLMTGRFEQWKLRDESAGPRGGFFYKQVPHVTLKSIAQNVHLDPVFSHHEPILDEKLKACNAALASVDESTRRLLRDKLARKQKEFGKKAISDADRRRWELPDTFEHWTVPFDTDDDWPGVLQSAVTEYRQAWRAKMDAVNKVIADHAESEDLVDKPEAVPGVVRVCGPFTVEAVQPPAISLGEESTLAFGGAPEELESFDEDGAAIPPVTIREAIPAGALQTETPEAYIEQMLRLLRTSGVMFPGNKVMQFSRLNAAGSGFGSEAIHGEGRWHPKDESDNDPQGEPNVAVCIGPQYGSISAHEIINARRAANRNDYDHLVFAGFSFDAAATAEIETQTRLKVQTHMAHIRPDANPIMNDLLKESGSDQMFSVFGAPRVRVLPPDAEGLVRVEMEGVDIFDPVKNEVVPTGAGKVAAWFLDSDYDGTVFCTTQAFFPDKSAWDKLERALKASFDAEVWQQLSGTVSLPFAPGEHRRAAVKVIDPRGNEVMQVVAL